MARKKDLAGLAALAGMAYLASRDKGGEAPAMPTASPAASATPDAGEDFIEAGSGMAPEGADYGNEGRREGPVGIGRVAPSATPRPRPAPNAGMSMTRMDPAKAEEARRMERQIVARDTALRMQEGERAVAAHKAKRLRQKEADEAVSLGGYKKGGSVKGWGAARGARKAKIY